MMSDKLQRQTDKFYYFIALLISIMPSCSEKKIVEENSNSNTIEAQHSKTLIEIIGSEVDKPEQSQYKEIIVKLEDPKRIKSMGESVYMKDVKTGQRYKVSNFREILGVRSSNEQQYVLKLYSDNSLYGIDPIYIDVPSPPSTIEK